MNERNKSKLWGRQAGTSLYSIIAASGNLLEIRKVDLKHGDYVLVETVNSIYRIRVVAEGMYEVSGGWFDKHGATPVITSITGCTWGASVIKVNIIAACGLNLEFGNKVTTSTIQKITVLHNWVRN
jgi:hypothetical protein